MTPARWILAAAALAIGVGLLAWRPWERSAVPPGVTRVNTPPALDLAGADPQAALAVRTAVARVQAAPDPALVWGELGMTLLAHELFAPAITSLEQAELRDASDARWPYLRGLALLRGEAAAGAAISALERGAELAALVPPAPALKLAEVLLEQGHVERAEQELERVVAKAPEDARALAGLGRAAYLRKDFSRARDLLMRSAARAPQVKATRALLAEVCQRLGDRSAADRERQAMAALPDAHHWPDPIHQQVIERWTGVLAAVERASDLAARGGAAQAVALLRRTVDAQPRALLARLSLGRMLLQASDPAAAEVELQAALAVEPSSFEAHHELGNALLRQGKLPQALASFTRAIEIKPEFAPSHHGIGLCRLHGGDRAGAIESFQSAVRFRSNHAQAHRDLGRALIAEGRVEEGREHLRHVLRLIPQDGDAAKLLEATAAGRDPGAGTAR